MDMKRVEEIINSKGIIEVTYKNSPVWLESISRNDGTVHVKLLSSDKAMNIPANELIEM